MAKINTTKTTKKSTTQQMVQKPKKLSFEEVYDLFMNHSW